jgi:uridine kinase
MNPAQGRLLWYDYHGMGKKLNTQHKRAMVMVNVTRSEARADARVTFADGNVYGGPVGTPLEAYVKAAYPNTQEDPILAAVIDNELCELTTPVDRDVHVHVLPLSSPDGGRIYRRSLVFILAVAVDALFPKTKIAVHYSITSGGYYCEVVGRANFSAEELAALRGRMRQMVAQDIPFRRQTIPLQEAIQWFNDHDDDDMQRLLKYREKDYLTIYRLGENMDYFFGYMAPSTGYINLFDLLATESGFILLYPRPEKPNILQPYQPSQKMDNVFRRAKAWQRVMGMEDIGALNDVINAGNLREEILIAEALHSRYLGQIAAAVAEQHSQGVRLVLIAGPSSAGKTTFSKRLAVQLMAYGIKPYTLAMDNYFVDRDQTPRDEAGNFDFESLAAMDVPRLNKDLLGLMENRPVQLPRFDFKQGRSFPGETVHLTKAHIIIAEGIHGLNPALLPAVPTERVYRIYVSALTALNIDRHNRVPTTDIRLLRRMVRDAAHRGYSAQDTLGRWDSVRRGEKRNIFPYQENADVMFNSSLAYELAVLRPVAEPLLRQVEPSSAQYIEAKRLLSFLRWVRPASADLVPDDSLLREFVGGSILETYMPGDKNSNHH